MNDMGVRRLFYGEAENFQGVGARTYFLPKKPTILLKKSKNILFWPAKADQGSKSRTPMFGDK